MALLVRGARGADATEEISRLEAALRERGHGATLRARGSVHSGTRRSKMTLVLLLRERERERTGTGRYHPHP